MSADLPKMPEPVAMLVRWSATKNEPANINPWVAVEMACYGPNPGRDEQQLFTADQMRAFAQEAARQAMERGQDERGRLNVAVALLVECLEPLEVAAAMDDEDNERFEKLRTSVETFVEAMHVVRTDLLPQSEERHG